MCKKNVNFVGFFKDIKIINMKKFKFIVLVALSLILLNSCLKSSFYYSGYMTFANVVNETTLAGDGGVTYNVLENASSKEFKSLERIFLNCDLLAAMDEDYSQDIKVNNFYEVQLQKLLIPESQTVTKADSLGILYRSWTVNKDEAQYFNLYVEFPCIKGNDTEHKIELVYEAQTEKSNEYFFYLYHDAGDDVWTKDVKEEDREVKGQYVSFRVEEIIGDIKYDGNTKFWILPASQKETPEVSPQGCILSLKSRKAE